MWLGAMSTFEFVAFHASVGSIEINGNNASARVFVSEVLVPTDGGLRRVEGQYHDSFKKSDGKWRFSRRSYQVVHDETKP